VCLNDIWMQVQDLLNLSWIDILSTTNEHFFGAPNDAAVAKGIQKGDVSVAGRAAIYSYAWF